ncbi:MAG: hypothetical protein RL662_1771 [Bacteroidota bacterium]|jgi:hypothetical protein
MLNVLMHTQILLFCWIGAVVHVCRACYRRCQENNDNQNDGAAPLIHEEAIVPPDPYEAEMARFRDWQRANEGAVARHRQEEEKYNAAHPQLDNRMFQDLNPYERLEIERFRSDERWEATRLAILTRAAENRAAQRDADIAILGDLEANEDAIN